MKNDDPYTSTRQYIESCANLEFCYESQAPRALGFTTTIGKHIAKFHECAELLMDSTHRTNSSKFEFFTIIVKVFGAGFPLASLFFEGNLQSETGIRQRKDVLCSFLF